MDNDNPLKNDKEDLFNNNKEEPIKNDKEDLLNNNNEEPLKINIIEASKNNKEEFKENEKEDFKRNDQRNDSDYYHEFKIVLLGEENVGKTSLIVRYLDNKFNESPSITETTDIRIKKIEKDDKILYINIWDTVGQEKFRNMTENFIKGADGVILVCDITNKKSYEKLGGWVNYLNSNFNKDEIIPILIENKIDLEQNKEVLKKELEEYRIKYKFKINSASAKTGEGVQQAFDYLIKKIIKKSNKINNSFKLKISDLSMNDSIYEKNNCKC